MLFVNSPWQGNKFGNDQLKKEFLNAGSSGDSKFGWDKVTKDEQPPEMDSQRSFVDAFMAMEESDRVKMGYDYNDLIVECTYKGKYCMPECVSCGTH